MTLQELSDASAVSLSYISQIERDQVTPTLGTLANLARALGLGLDYFVTMPKVADSLVRRQDRRRFSLDGLTQQYEQVGADLPNHELSAFIIYVPAGYHSEAVSHDGEEFIHLLSGRLEIVLDGENLTLRKGDSLHYRGNRRHSWSNATGKEAQLLWVGRLIDSPLNGLRRQPFALDVIAAGDGESASKTPSPKPQKGVKT